LSPNRNSSNTLILKFSMFDSSGGDGVTIGRTFELVFSLAG
jgi:hypothetical protein